MRGGPLRLLQRLAPPARCRAAVQRASAATLTGHRAADRLHRLEVARRRDREAGLHDVHAELGELVRHPELLGHGHAAAGGLLAVAQRGVEDEDSVGVVAMCVNLALPVEIAANL